MAARLRCLPLLVLGGAVLAATAKAGQAALTGTVTAHDPSTVIQEGNVFWYYCTGNGPGLRTRYSFDLKGWSSASTVLATPPSWVTTYAPGFDPATHNLWAPDIAYWGGLYHLYFAAAGSTYPQSAIGMATSPTLDQSSLNYKWTDSGGPVISSTTGSPTNAIDPSILQDTNGTKWMSFGSYGAGIYLTQLDPNTGLRLNPSVAPTRIAQHNDSIHSIEASYLYKRGNYYYLFVNWGSCCNGVNSTYEVRMGRSTSVTGPYLDKNNSSMVLGGGTQFLDRSGGILGNSSIIGPGHIGIMTTGGQDYFSFHYYDGSANGLAKFDILPLSWTADGWPSAVTVPEPTSVAILGVGVSWMLVSRRRTILR